MASSWEEAMSIFDNIIRDFKFSNAAKVEKAIAALPESRGLQLFRGEPEDIFARLQAYDDECVPEQTPSKILSVDQSCIYVKHLLPEPAPTLPETSAALDAELRRSYHVQLPVTAECYTTVHTQNSQLAEECLVSTDGSTLPANISTFILKRSSSANTELDVTLHVSPALSSIFSLLEEYSGLELKPKLTFNITENDTSGRAVAVGKRPDTLGTANSCTFLIGEDKKRKLQDEVADLKRKKSKLSRLHYGKVRFIIGYAAAEGRFRWFWLGADESDIHDVGEELNLSNLRDRIKLLQNMTVVFRLLDVMARDVPKLTGRLPVYEVLERYPGCQILILKGGVQKTMFQFEKYCAEFQTSFDLIDRAYKAAEEAANEAAAQSRPPFIISAKAGPELKGRRGTFDVETTPLGYEKEPSNIGEARAIALACCKTARVLHAKNIVYRDFCLPNIVCLGPHPDWDRKADSEAAGPSQKDKAISYMVIDLEGVGEKGAIVTKECQLAVASEAGVLETDRSYTERSDMYQIGGLLRSILLKLDAYHGDAREFVCALRRKELTAVEALRHPWLTSA